MLDAGQMPKAKAKTAIALGKIPIKKTTCFGEVRKGIKHSQRNRGTSR